MGVNVLLYTAGTLALVIDERTCRVWPVSLKNAVEYRKICSINSGYVNTRPQHVKS